MQMFMKWGVETKHSGSHLDLLDLSAFVFSRNKNKPSFPKHFTFGLKFHEVSLQRQMPLYHQGKCE